MKKIITGKAYVLGANIDTDQIIPAEHLVYSLGDETESRKYGQFALSGVPPGRNGLPAGNIPFIHDGQWQSDYSIIVAGANFGCGSSREHAPFALQKSGVKMVIAESYARIFYRNAVDGGFLVPYDSIEPLSPEIKTGDMLKVDMETNNLLNISSGKHYQLKALGNVLPIVEAGGIFKYARSTGMIK